MTQVLETPTRGSNFLNLLFRASHTQVMIDEVGKSLGTCGHNCIRSKIGLELKMSINYETVYYFRLAKLIGLRESMKSAKTPSDMT